MATLSIQNNIRTLRFMANEMTQQELAEAIGVSRQTIVAIEKGNYSPSLELAFRIAHVFQTPIDQVFAYDERLDQNFNKKNKKKQRSS